MGVSFWIRPIDAEAKDRLRQADVKVPRRLPASRPPTVAELRKVLASLAGYVVGFSPKRVAPGDDLRIDVGTKKAPKSGPWLSILVREYRGEDMPLPELYVERGTPAAVAALTAGLATVTGPLLLDGEDVYGPHLVDGERSPAELVSQMEARAAEEFGDAPDG